MPSITLTASTAEANRLIASLNGTPYSKDVAGVKQLLIDYLKARVMEHEKAASLKTALAAVTGPANVVIS